LDIFGTTQWGCLVLGDGKYCKLSNSTIGVTAGTMGIHHQIINTTDNYMKKLVQNTKHFMGV
jgi:hypothetical protein